VTPLLADSADVMAFIVSGGVTELPVPVVPAALSADRRDVVT
jgi:hypothetical protein